jgi:hypothetical protein
VQILQELIAQISTLYFRFLENHAVFEIMSKNTVEREGPQMTLKYGAYKLHAV